MIRWLIWPYARNSGFICRGEVFIKMNGGAAPKPPQVFEAKRTWRVAQQRRIPLIEPLPLSKGGISAHPPRQKKGELSPSLSFAVQAQCVNRSEFICLRPERRQGASAPAPCNWQGAPTHPALILSATPGRPAAGVTLHTSPVAHQRVVAAFAAGFAFIALHFRLCAGVKCHDA